MYVVVYVRACTYHVLVHVRYLGRAVLHCTCNWNSSRRKCYRQCCEFPISCQLVSGKSWITCEDYNFFICEGRITIQHATEEVSDNGRHGLCQDSFDNLHRSILGECFRFFSSRPEQSDQAWTVGVKAAQLSEPSRAGSTLTSSGICREIYLWFAYFLFFCRRKDTLFF